MVPENMRTSGDPVFLFWQERNVRIGRIEKRKKTGFFMDTHPKH
jgi:hypothetical protein